jgi:glycosidase
MKISSYISIALAAMLMAACGDDNAETPTTPDNSTPTVTVTAPTEIIYEANPRMYGGDGKALVRLQDQLSDIKKAGATILWVMPVNTPGEDSKAIGSPYCVKDYKGVNSRLGTMQDFKNLVNTAHGKGMKVILDWVANHTSWDNAWITEHPNWYVQDASGNILAPSSWTDVAELNYDNTAMRKEMIADLLYWVSETGIDGYRFDNVDGVPHDFWAEACKELKAANAEIILLAESNDKECYTDGFTMTYGWNYGPALPDLFSGKKDLAKLVSISEAELTAAPSASAVMRYAVNHDTMSETGSTALYGGVDATECAYAIAMMSGGTPMFYTTQMTTLSGKQSFFDYSQAAWDSTRIANLGKLADVFNATAELRSGTLRYYTTGGVVMEYVAGTQHLLLMANPTNAEATLRVPIELASSTVTNMLSNESVKLGATVTLPAYGYAVYKK